MRVKCDTFIFNSSSRFDKYSYCPCSAVGSAISILWAALSRLTSGGCLALYLTSSIAVTVLAAREKMTATAVWRLCPPFISVSLSFSLSLIPLCSLSLPLKHTHTHTHTHSWDYVLVLWLNEKASVAGQWGDDHVSNPCTTDLIQQRDQFHCLSHLCLLLLSLLLPHLQYRSQYAVLLPSTFNLSFLLTEALLVYSDRESYAEDAVLLSYIFHHLFQQKLQYNMNIP